LKAVPLRVGVLSDTHGLLRPEARQFLIGADFLIHAGDIGDPLILDTLAAIAPLTVVRGNNDTAAWGRRLKAHELIRIGGIFIYVVHDRAEAKAKWAAQARVVVSGHSHRPQVEERDGTLYLNPGSCGPRRFKLPVSVGELTVSGAAVTARTVDLTA
jgi:uncharacterized protein